MVTWWIEHVKRHLADLNPGPLCCDALHCLNASLTYSDHKDDHNTGDNEDYYRVNAFQMHQAPEFELLHNTEKKQYLWLIAHFLFTSDLWPPTVWPSWLFTDQAFSPTDSWADWDICCSCGVRGEVSAT